MQVMHEGGVFTTRTVDRESEAWEKLIELNAGLAPALGMVHGVTHAEYIRAHADGRFYFLEIAARVGGAFISDLVEAATGINLWREWARIEVADLRGEPYVLPQIRTDYAGSVLCLAKTAEPDTSSFNEPEIVLRMKKLHHAGLIVRSPKPQRVAELLDRIQPRICGTLPGQVAAAGQAHVVDSDAVVAVGESCMSTRRLPAHYNGPGSTHGNEGSVPAPAMESSATGLGAGFATSHAAAVARRSRTKDRAVGNYLRSGMLSLPRQQARRRGRESGLRVHLHLCKRLRRAAARRPHRNKSFGVCRCSLPSLRAECARCSAFIPTTA